MSNTDSDEINLASLPSDIIREIKKCGQNDLDAMLMISRRWNALCRVSIPWMCWRNNSADHTNTVNFCIPERLQNDLGVSNWSCKWLQRDSDTESMVEIRKNISSTQGFLSLAKFFRRCLSFEKCLIDVALKRGQREIAHLARCLSKCLVGELEIAGSHFNNSDPDAILELLGCHTVKTLRVFDYNLCALANIHLFTHRPFFIEVASRVSKVEIESAKSRESAQEYIKIFKSVMKTLNKTRRIEAKLELEKFSNGKIRFIVTIFARQPE